MRFIDESDYISRPVRGGNYIIQQRKHFRIFPDDVTIISIRVKVISPIQRFTDKGQSLIKMNGVPR